MRVLALTVFTVLFPALAFAQPAPPPPEPVPGQKKNANPCADEVSAALQKLRKSSWFRMNTRMITENGPTEMQIDYVLPDKMHQTVTVVATQQTSEIILVGNDAWSKQQSGGWKQAAPNLADQLKKQMSETVLQDQADVGDYSCKGRTQFEGRDVFSYKLESEKSKEEGAPQNETFRMFYIDALTGLPFTNALMVPSREKPIFKTTYSFPIDLSIEPPKDVEKASGPASPAPAAATPPGEKK